MDKSIAITTETPLTSQTHVGSLPGRPIRVLHLVSALNMGGLEKVVYDLTRLADQDHFDVQVACLDQAGALAESFANEGISVRELQILGKGPTYAIRKLTAILRRDRPDVLQTHNPQPHVIGSTAAFFARVPVVVHTKHGRNYPDQPRKVWMNRIASWMSNQVVPVSADSEKVTIEIEKVKRSKVQRIWNGIDLHHFARVSSAVARSPLNAIHVARLDDRAKDQRTLLQATRLVLDQKPQFRLSIVGDGPDRADLETLCGSLKLRDNVVFHGFRSEVHELLSESGLFVLSSVTEGLSLTLLEAMANGLPIVATRVGGNPEAVSDEVTGLLVPPKSPRALAEAILAMIDNPSRAAEMGAAGRARVEEHFDVRKVVATYENLYRELLTAQGYR